MLTFPKPERGSRRKELLAKRAGLRTLEKMAKAQVRDRDKGECRVPGCVNGRAWVIEVAHLEHKGMGGDKQMDRTQVDKMLCLCKPHHQGARSHHSGDLRIEPTTPQGTSGPCDFWITDEQRQWKSLGSN